jgi:hypothetical protein
LGNNNEHVPGDNDELEKSDEPLMYLSNVLSLRGFVALGFLGPTSRFVIRLYLPLKMEDIQFDP